jgi:hypothetical protein
MAITALRGDRSGEVMVMTRSKLVAGVLALILLSAVGLTAARSSGKALEPMVVGWERIFKLDWQATERGGAPVLQGYLVNDSPYLVTRIQLLVEGLDPSGDVVGQRVAWMPGTLTPFSRAYFSEAAPRPASAYRVRVFAFDRVESPSRED